MLLFLAGLLGISQPASAADGKFVNLSNRGLVGEGDDVRIVGFIIEDGARQVLVQALGPELANRGIANALADPVLTVIQTHEGEPPRTPLNPPVELMVNDNWEDSQGQLVSDLWGGSPPLTAGSLSAAVVLTLEPGGYTARVEGKNGTVGVANVEVYRIASSAAASPDREALTALYNALDGANWTDRTNWLSDEPMEEWYGVEVDDNGRVIVLTLGDNQLNGPIPPELGGLSNLEELLLSGNELSGTIPAQLGDLTSLRFLDLDDNQLNGPIPSELGNLSNLIWLHLNNNQLSGPIPAELGNLSNLFELHLNSNQLSGPIPAELGNLGILYLGGNQLSGCIPDGLRDVLENDLSTLGLAYCDDSGTETDDRAALMALYNATDGANWTNNANWLSDAQLDRWHGVITDDDGRVTWIDLPDNQLSGPIPVELGSLTNLRTLNLRNNQLNGPIPVELGSLTNLEGLWLDNNQGLSGSLPSSFATLNRLIILYVNGTGLCTPTEAAFQTWLQGIEDKSDIVNCVASGFALSGIVTDSRKEGLVVPGAILWLEGASQESETTNADGQYRFSNISGEVEVTVTAPASYLEQTTEVTIDSTRTLDFALEHIGEPPYSGTPWVTPDILGPSDSTSLGNVTFTGRGTREIFDRRVNKLISVDAYLFDVQFGQRTVEFQINPEVGNREAARTQIDVFAPAIGRLPAVLMSNIRQVEINAGEGLFGGSSQTGGLLIHTDDPATHFAVNYGYLEEIFLHEAAHASLDPAHFDSPGWRRAQGVDGVAISDYANDYPDREDIAESFLAYFAVHYRPNRLTNTEKWFMKMTIPNRLAYFDRQQFDMSPYRRPALVAPVLAIETMRPIPRIWMPFDAPIVTPR